MPLVLTATVGGATSNAYDTAANALLYFAGRANATAFTGATTAVQEQALVMAASLLERERWKGVKGMTPAGALTQALAWPRRWAPTREADAEPQLAAAEWEDLTLAYYSELAIPQPILRGAFELALEILKAGATDPFAAGGTVGENVKQRTVDVLTTVYFDPADRSTGLGRFPSVIAEVGFLLREAGAVEVERV